MRQYPCSLLHTAMHNCSPCPVCPWIRTCGITGVSSPPLQHAGFKEFCSALSCVHMVEMSPALRAMQWAALHCEQQQQQQDKGPHG